MPTPLKENRTNAAGLAGARQLAHAAAEAAASSIIEDSMKKMDKYLLGLKSMYDNNLGDSKEVKELITEINALAREIASLSIVFGKDSLEKLNKRINNVAKALYGDDWRKNVYDYDMSAVHKAKGHILAAVEEHQPGEDAATMLSRLDGKMADQLLLLFNMMGLDPNKYSETLSNLAELKHTLRLEELGSSFADQAYAGRTVVAQLGKPEPERQLTSEEIAEINKRLENFGKKTEES